MRETERERELGKLEPGEGNGNRGIGGTGTERRGEREQCNWGMLMGNYRTGYNRGNGE